MKRLLATVSLLAALGTPWWNSAVAKDKITGADAAAIHNVVRSQLEALSKDDAAGAFKLATSEKRMQIGSADNFLQLIKEQYPPIYHYQTVIFSRPELIDGNAIQVVRVTDSDSHVWLAIFSVQQEEDRTWKIDGCDLLETTTVSV